MNKLMLYFFIFSLSLFAKDKNEFTKINTFKAVIIENSHLNKRKKTKEYQVLASLPDKLIKKMISPSINQGEIYLYNGSNKTIYYPLLEQTISVGKKKIVIFFISFHFSQLSQGRLSPSTEEDSQLEIFERKC